MQKEFLVMNFDIFRFVLGLKKRPYQFVQITVGMLNAVGKIAI
jgi:hypothetical protein